ETLYEGVEAEPISGSPLNSEADEWKPYPNKLLFLLDVLDNLPRLRLSDSLMKVFLWILRESGARDVPSLDGLRKVQKALRSKCGVPTTPKTSPRGNLYFMNDLRSIVAKDWANPRVRPLIQIYPEIPSDGVIREVWHAQKWLSGKDRNILSPMFNDRRTSKHYYVDEICRLRNGQLIIPVQWVIHHNEVHTNAYPVVLRTSGDVRLAFVLKDEPLLISASQLEGNYYDLEHENLLPNWSSNAISDGFPEMMPNPKRELADGEPLYSSFVDIFGDDVSGNRSKSWNKHWNTYATHRNLPRELLQQEYHIHFISTSPNASIPEQFMGVSDVVKSTHREPVRVRDAMTGEMMRFQIYVNAEPGDNPMQSEVCSHIGSGGNYYCRKCKAGGTQKERAQDEGYHALFQPGIARSGPETLAGIKKQVQLACAGVAAPVNEFQTSTGIKDPYTQFWVDDILARFKVLKSDPNRPRNSKEIEKELLQWVAEHESDIVNGLLTLPGTDPTKDTPVEILHTGLLGVVKYTWHSSHTAWSESQKAQFIPRLQATDITGLSIPSIRAKYFTQYANSLIGRQLKTLSQTAIFHIHDLVDVKTFAIWKAVGELAALLWMPEIRNIDEYCEDLRTAAGNVLDTFAIADPSKILAKIKLHLLTHLDEDVRAFGPLVGMATENYEAFNSIFRFCSVLSNHLAPSRDIARQLASQEGVKHLMLGGWWPGHDGKWCQAGVGVQDFFTNHPNLQRLVGWSEKVTFVPGTSKLKPASSKAAKARSTLSLMQTSAAKALNINDYQADSAWHRCQYVITTSHEKCYSRCWIFAMSPIDVPPIHSPFNQPFAGRVSDLLHKAHGGSRESIAVVDVFQIATTRHELYGMPVLRRRADEEQSVIISGHNISFIFNAQHDCQHALCDASGTVPRRQEREDTGLMDACIEHKPVHQFIINLHAFHNAHLLRTVLPRSLSAPIPLFDDRRSKHNELAASLRVSQTDKRAQQKVRQGENKRKRDAEKQRTQSGANGSATSNAPVPGPSTVTVVPGSSRSPSKRQRRGQVTAT
ncbi:hypothetical protein PLEOSDRAFT_1041925, partial [Pleurotus ostreatus PC15]